MTIDELQLEPVAEQAARLLQQKHPNVEFTSGRRNISHRPDGVSLLTSLPAVPVIGDAVNLVLTPLLGATVVRSELKKH